MPSFRLSCLAYLSVAVPGSTLGLLWPLMRLSWHQPLGLLGALLIIGVSATVVASVLTGRLMSRVRTGPIVAAGAAAIALALAAESAAPSVWVFAGGMVVSGVGFGALDTALNAHAAAYFGPRRINWMHASYGLGATGGPLLATGLLATGLLAAGLGWRGTYGVQAAVQGVVAVLLALTWRAWDRPAPTPDPPASDPPAAEPPAFDRIAPAPSRPAARAGALTVLIGAAFAAVECGIESGAGVWGYVFLTAGLGLIIGALTASALGPALLLLSLLLAGLHRCLGRRTGEAGGA